MNDSNTPAVAQPVQVQTIPTPAPVPSVPAPNLGPIPSELKNATFTDIFRLARQLADSDLISEGLRRKPADVAVILLTGKELGLTPMMALRGIVVIKGKPTFEAAMMRALVLGRDPTAKIEFLESTERLARARFSREGQQPFETKFTIEEATKAGLTGKDNWKFYATDMLVARVTARGCRAVWPDVLFGCYLPDELEEIVASGPTAPPPAPTKRRGGSARSLEETIVDVDPQVDEPMRDDADDSTDTIDTTAAAGAGASSPADQDPSKSSADTPKPPSPAPAGRPSATYGQEESEKRTRLRGAILQHSQGPGTPLSQEDVEIAYQKANVSFDVASFDEIPTDGLTRLCTALSQAVLAKGAAPRQAAPAATTPQPTTRVEEPPMDDTMRLSAARRDPALSEKLKTAAESCGLSMRMPIGNWPSEQRAKVTKMLFGEG